MRGEHIKLLLYDTVYRGSISARMGSTALTLHHYRPDS